MGKSQRSQLYDRLATLVVHLLKWERQPDRRGRSWALTIIEQRVRLAKHLKDNPSLRPLAAETASEAYGAARARAPRETRLPLAGFPKALPYGIDDVLNDEWLPGSSMPDDL